MHPRIIKISKRYSSLKVSVGSPNPVKIRAVRNAFSKYFEELEITSADVPSGVKAFPDSEELIYRGAMNRALAAFCSVDYSVGIEGGVVLFGGRWYDRNYVSVYDGNEMGVGTSASYEVPKLLVEEVDPETDESKRIIDRRLGVEDVFSNQGVIGVFTRMEISREELLTDAVVCALTRFLNPGHYPEAEK